MASQPGTLNNTKPATLYAGFYNLITAWLAAGFHFIDGGDGLAAHSATFGTVFSNADAAGANGWSNSHAWARIGYPTGSRELLIQNGSTGDGYLILFVSKSAGFVTGSPSATVAPTASDQGAISGAAINGTGTAILIAYTQGQTYFPAICDDQAPYNFWMAAFAQGGLSVGAGIASDFLSNLSSGSGGTDTEGYIYRATSTMWNSGNLNTWSGYVNGAWQSGYISSLSGISSNAGSVGNAFTQGDDVCPLLVGCRNDGSHDFILGYTQQFLFDYHATTHNSLDLLNVGGTRILLNYWSMPWDGSVVVKA